MYPLTMAGDPRARARLREAAAAIAAGHAEDAVVAYREALRLNPYYADTHFYLAVTCEKMGLSQEARPHWRAYQQLAPNGEWVELAREFSE